MGELKGITINTDPAAEAHICAEDDAAIYQSIVGSDGVMMIGQQCESQVISNNKVRVKDGVIVVGGHFARIPYGDYIDCEIANGQSGRNRNDIIIAKFVTTGTGGIDTYTLEVKQGASTTGSATDPALTQNNLYESGKIREMPLYRVKIEGLSITKIEKMFESVPTIPMLNAYLSELQAKLAGYEYSKDEQIIGRWINGQNLYRKFVEIGNFSSGQSTIVPHKIQGLSRLVQISGMALKTTDGTMMSIPFAATDPTYSISVTINTQNVEIKHGTGRSSYWAMVILEYIKNN